MQDVTNDGPAWLAGRGVLAQDPVLVDRVERAVLPLQSYPGVDEAGKPLFEVLNTVTFAAQGGKTKLTVQAKVVKSTAKAAPYLDGMEEGWKQTIERLAGHMAKADCGATRIGQR